MKDENMGGEVQRWEKWVNICMSPTGKAQRWTY